MTMATAIPRLRLGITKRRVSLLIVIVVIIIAMVGPIVTYWALQRDEMHRLWVIEANESSQFRFQLDYGASLMTSTFSKWTNETSWISANEISYANEYLTLIGGIDTEHAAQLDRISQSIDYAIRPFFSIPPANVSLAGRTVLSGQLGAIGQKVQYAYTNFENYTYITYSPMAGAPFWYSGPSPPDEGLLQQAVNIALALQQPT